MIGNDIIDIAYTRQHSDWTRRGFLDKIFTPTEQNYIAKSDDPFTTVWKLWSMKESAYKLHLRSKQERSFSPSSISCDLLDNNNGIVTYGGVEYHTNTNCLSNYVFSFATHKNSLEVNHEIMEFDRKLPENYYDIIKNKLVVKLNCNCSQIEIVKNGVGIPEIYCGGIRQDIYLSITHHGQFLAWSFVK